MRGRSVGVALTLTTMVLVGACTSSSSGKAASSREASSTVENGQPVAGGSATFLQWQEAPTLDSAKILFGQAASLALSPIYDTLVEVAADGTMVPRLALSVTSADGKVWSVHLRSGVKFSDGTSFDAAAVVAYWDRLANPATASPGFNDASQIMNKQVVDPLTITVTLKSRNGQWPRMLMEELGSVPSPTAVAQEGAAFGNHPVGAGPFLVKEWLKDSHLTLVRNPNYWDAPRPYLDQLIIRPVPDDQQRFDTMASGAADFAYYPLWTQPLLQAADQRTKIVRPSILGGRGYFFNSGRAPFDDVSVRQAFVLAADVNAVNNSLTNGRAELVQGLFPKGSPFYDPSVNRPVPNLAKAQQLIDAYTAQHGPIKVTALDTQQNSAVAQAFQQQWQRLHGVTVSLSIVDANAIVRRQKAGDFDLVDAALQGADPEPVLYNRLDTNGTFNGWRFSNARIDSDLERGRVALNLKDRIAAYTDLQKLFWDQAPILLYDRLPAATVTVKRIKGFKVFDQGQPAFSGVWLSHS